jgi:hypothetical protein
MDKAKAQVRHFIRRARERFGVRLNKEGVREIVKMIQHNELPHVGSQSTARTAFLIPVGDGREAVVIYDKNRQTPRTILTREMWEARECQIEARA